MNEGLFTVCDIVGCPTLIIKSFDLFFFCSIVSGRLLSFLFWVTIKWTLMQKYRCFIPLLQIISLTALFLVVQKIAFIQFTQHSPYFFRYCPFGCCYHVGNTHFCFRAKLSRLCNIIKFNGRRFSLERLNVSEELIGRNKTARGNRAEWSKIEKGIKM